MGKPSPTGPVDHRRPAGEDIKVMRNLLRTLVGKAELFEKRATDVNLDTECSCCEQSIFQNSENIDDLMHGAGDFLRAINRVEDELADIEDTFAALTEGQQKAL